jgi:hypothetical protein
LAHSHTGLLWDQPTIHFPQSRGISIDPRFDSAVVVNIRLRPSEIIFFRGCGHPLVFGWKGAGPAKVRKMSSERRITVRWVLLSLFGVVWGIALFVEGLEGFCTPGRFDNDVGKAVVSALFMPWSFALIVIPILKLVNRMHLAQ